MKKKKKSKITTMYWQVHTANLFSEIATHSRDAVALARPLDITAKILFVLADVAREIDNEELHSICCRLTLFEEADKSSKLFDPKAIELIHRFDEKFINRLSKG
jgi:hypothetical protein